MQKSREPKPPAGLAEFIAGIANRLSPEDVVLDAIREHWREAASRGDQHARPTYGSLARATGWSKGYVKRILSNLSISDRIVCLGMSTNRLFVPNEPEFTSALEPEESR